MQARMPSTLSKLYKKKIMVSTPAAHWISSSAERFDYAPYFARFSLLQLQVEIEVDLSFPERNREVFVFYYSGKKHQGKLHDGFSIKLVADVRDVTKVFYKAFLLPNRTDVFIQFPAQSASFALDH